MINVTSLSKSFHRQEAVHDVSFTVGAGEVLGLIGPNGAGKTTILRSIAGILRPDTGAIAIGGHDMRGDSVAAKRLLAYLPDQPSFFETLTAWEHVRFIASVYQVDGFERRAEELFEAFDLATKRDAFAAELSRGQRQRLGLVCALVHSPRAVLLDEPMLGLDPRGIKALNDWITAAARGGAAVIMSSHLLGMLQKTCTKVLLLRGGRTQVYGTVEQVSQVVAQGDPLSLEELFFQATEPEGQRADK